MRDPFLTDLNEVDDREDFKETLRFACGEWSQDEILFNLAALFLGFSGSQLQTCSAVAHDGIEREVLPYTTTYQCRHVASVGLCLA